ncbi:ATP-binding protein [Clostridium botulinum]|uniref:ATP-binding protein n=1 Tax=Clostridium botulinum TaxID=1491 RepID=A0AA43YA33_CLOBO|nr:ATP-binding protein [Clostridium botulinum]NFI23006.1 ATP-binding protein [Clostridium botulinum]NFQ79583.1 ATP-binding protein [Clostridium botulinum]RHW55784.1 ATP-binding protein [Clostridium botulinum]
MCKHKNYENENNNLLDKILELAEYGSKENPILDQCSIKEYDCEKCKDTGIIWTTKGTTFICECQIEKKRKKVLISHGFTLNMLEKYSIDNYKYAENKIYMKLYSNSKKFLNDFINNSTHSLALLGQSGCGKTHLLTSIGKILLDKNIDVRYYKFNNLVDKIKNDRITKINTTTEKEALNCEVLIIDNFLMKDNTPTDERIIFDILEYRYDNNLPVLVGSTLLLNDIVNINMGIAGRLSEMCNGGDTVIEVIGKEYDYRLRNTSYIGGDIIGC